MSLDTLKLKIRRYWGNIKRSVALPIGIRRNNTAIKGYLNQIQSKVLHESYFNVIVVTILVTVLVYYYDANKTKTKLLKLHQEATQSPNVTSQNYYNLMSGLLYDYDVSPHSLVRKNIITDKTNTSSYAPMMGSLSPNGSPQEGSSSQDDEKFNQLRIMLQSIIREELGDLKKQNNKPEGVKPENFGSTSI